ncbi:MAG: zinc-binding dehydrogenase [bacterium]|nr:zinc-binding dehydrogenase [bacterium]
MRAAVFRETGKRLEIVDLDLEDPRAGEVKIDVAASGICRSDLSVTTGTLRSPLPVVLGHEAAGVVTQLGEGVENLALGDHVVVALTPACGNCLFCNEGAPNRCIKMVPGMIGSTMLDGTTRLRQGSEVVYQLCGVASFAEQAVVCAQSCVRIAHEVALSRACLLGCGVLTGAGAVFNTTDIREGAGVVVIGCGGVGLAAIQAARIVGASPIIAIDIDPAKLALAEQLGATHSLDGREDVKKAIRKLTGLGAHVSIEAIGTSATIETAWEVLRPGGLALVIGMPPGKEKIPIRAGGLFVERRLAGSVYGGANPHVDIPRLLEYVERGEFHLDPLVSEELPLDDAADALEALAAGEGARHVIVNAR